MAVTLKKRKMRKGKIKNKVNSRANRKNKRKNFYSFNKKKKTNPKTQNTQWFKNKILRFALSKQLTLKQT